MVSSRRQRHEKPSRSKRKTVGRFQFWRRPGSNDARVIAKIWPGTYARRDPAGHRAAARSEEHTSELQSRPHLVCRLLLEKKKKKKKTNKVNKNNTKKKTT